MAHKTIYVTKPSLPPLDEFLPFLEEMWETKWLTNNGPFHQKFEAELCRFLGIEYCSLFANGTLALIIGLQALGISGEVITTPFSFVATTHALNWNGITPVFCDIESRTFNIDPDKIEPLITDKTTAIMPVHVYGNPCDVNKIDTIAEKYHLKVIYDAAHAFNVKVNGNSILNSGDMSILSFHATKVFHTFEGGAIVCNRKELKDKIDFLKNFGFENEESVVGPGINGKMSEFNAALGLLQLKYVHSEIEERKKISDYYKSKLNNLSGITYIKEAEGVVNNYSYFPILIDPEKYGKSRDEIYDAFRKKNIYVRKYFFPLISEFPIYRDLESASPKYLNTAINIGSQILCLPIYKSLEMKDVDEIIKELKGRI